MAAPFLPPPNLAGISPPPPPQNPVVYADIAPALDYVCQLNDRHQMGSATADEVGIAECYKAALVFSAMAPNQVPAAPPWVQALQAMMDQQFANINQQLANMANEITAIRNEQPILLTNSTAGNSEPLFNPTVPGWVLLAPPNPTTRDQLLTFTRAECIASAVALGLPALPLNTPVATLRREIASKLGVFV